MMRHADREALRTALGAEAVVEHAPFEVDGASLACTVRPEDGDQLGRALRALGERGLAVLVRGGGSRLDLGNPPGPVQAFLSTEALAGIDVLDAEEGVAHVGAGTPLAWLRERAQSAGWEMPLDPPGAASTLGGTLASGALGPRANGFGPARRVVLGLQVVLGSGERVTCGGRVVKNVTGYDLQKLYTGSLGTLAVIEAAWIRLHPRPERVAVLRGCLAPGSGDPGGGGSARLPGTQDRDPLAISLGVARRSGTRAVALLDPALAARVGLESGSPSLVVELAGFDSVVEETRRSLERELGMEAAPGSLLDRIQALQGESEPGAVRVRVDARPTLLAAAALPLREVGGSILAYPGLGLLFGYIPPERVAAADGTRRILAACRRAARAGGGGYRIEAAPLVCKQAGDVFGEAQDTLPLMQALKAQFDPAGVLNPGRFAGCI